MNNKKVWIRLSSNELHLLQFLLNQSNNDLQESGDWPEKKEHKKLQKLLITAKGIAQGFFGPGQEKDIMESK